MTMPTRFGAVPVAWSIGVCLALSLLGAASAPAGPVNADGDPLHVASAGHVAVAPAAVVAPGRAIPASRPPRAPRASARDLLSHPEPAAGVSARQGLPTLAGIATALALVALTVVSGALRSERSGS